MPIEHQGITGVLTITQYTSEGQMLAHQVAPNLITLAGKQLLARLLTGGVDSTLDLTMAVGTGKRAPAATDTALEQLVEEVPASLDGIEVVGGGVRVRVRATIPQKQQEGTAALCEAGILARAQSSPKDGANASAWPVLFNRVTFDVLSQTSNTSIMLAWDITL